MSKATTITVCSVGKNRLHSSTSVSGFIDHEDVSMTTFREGINGGAGLALKLQKIIWHFGSDRMFTLRSHLKTWILFKILFWDCFLTFRSHIPADSSATDTASLVARPWLMFLTVVSRRTGGRQLTLLIPSTQKKPSGQGFSRQSS